MTLQSSYQPFLIGQGHQKTGLFSYLDSWIKPEDAYDTLVNAFVYRGSLYQREGMFPFPSSNGNGALVYQNNEETATGNGVNVTFSFTLSKFPLLASTVTISAIVSGTVLQATDNGSGSLSGALVNAGFTHTINYTTGALVFTTNGAPDNLTPVMVQYNYVPTALTTPINNPIMGIKTWINDTNNTQVIVVMDTKRANYYNTSTKSFTPIQSFQQFLYIFPLNTSPSVTTGAITTQWMNIAPLSVTVKTFTGAGVLIDTTTDVPTSTTAGNFKAIGNITAASTIAYNTGIVTINFTASPSDYTYVQITASLQGDYFTGNNSNFFNATNWRTTDAAPSYLYMTNNVDFITLYDGTNLARPPFGLLSTNFTQAVGGFLLYPKVNQITTALDVRTFKNRLIFVRPTEVGVSSPEAQSIFFSQNTTIPPPPSTIQFTQGNLNFALDQSGNGGFIQAATGDWIQSDQFLRDALIVFFQNSTWILRSTGNGTDPFRIDQLNNSRSTNAPYGSVPYDSECTSMGAKGLIYCDGVSVNRYDENVIDLFLDINQNKFGQCFAQKFDTLNQTWMLYPSEENDDNTSDSVIVYNFLEKTWAIFQPSLGNLVQTPTTINTLSCLGLGFTITDLKWSDFAVGSNYFGGNGLIWSQATVPWNYYVQQDLSPTLLGGDENGYVYILNDGPTDTPGTGTANGIPTLIQTKRLNPFVNTGEKARFGYLDVYYEINTPVRVTFNFYINNSDNINKSTIFTFDGPQNNIWGWKRIYLNMVGEFLQVEINSLIQPDATLPPFYNTKGVFKILGMILYASPAGRLTPGQFV